MEKIDLWQYEREAWAEGYAAVCGCDEAGAGPLAGPVYAAAVILSQGVELDGLNDSKKLTPKKRDILFDAIREQASAWAVAWVDAGEIDETDILSARMKAMQLAIDRLAKAADLPSSTATGTKGSAPPSPPRTGPSSRETAAAPALPRPPFWLRSAGTAGWRRRPRPIPSMSLSGIRGTAPSGTMSCCCGTDPVPSTAGPS